MFNKKIILLILFFVGVFYGGNYYFCACRKLQLTIVKSEEPFEYDKQGTDFRKYRIDVRLENTSNDTLYFVNYNCTVNQLYKIESDSMLINIARIVCSRNFPETFMLPPHQLYEGTLVLVKTSLYRSTGSSGRFRVGFPYTEATAFFEGKHQRTAPNETWLPKISKDEAVHEQLEEGDFVLWSNYLELY